MRERHDLLRVPLGPVGELLHAEVVGLALLDEDQMILRGVAHRVGDQPVSFHQPVVLGGEDETGDVGALTVVLQEVAELGAALEPSVLSVPVVDAAQGLVGVLCGFREDGKLFSSEERNLLRALSAQVGVAAENADRFLTLVGKNMELLETKEELEERLRELDVLYEIAQRSAAASRVEQIIESSLDCALRAFDASACLLVVRREVLDEMFVLRSGASDVERSSVEEGTCSLASYLDIVDHRIVTDLRSDPLLDESSLEQQLKLSAQSLALFPVAWPGVQALLVVCDRDEGMLRFSPSDTRFGMTIATQLGNAASLLEGRATRAKQERLSTIGQLMSGVLHDLRTPMTVINGYVQLMATEEDSRQRQVYAEGVSRQVGHVQAMTMETLAFARGDRKLWVRKVYLHRFFDALIEQVRRELDGMPVAVVLELIYRGVAQFDAHKVERAITNLVRNASDAFGEAGGQIIIKVSLDNEEPALHVSVRDNGPGIAPEILARVFEAFATYGKKEGTGLGLAVVKSIAEEHGGRVAVRSEPGRTEFQLVLPQP